MNENRKRMGMKEEEETGTREEVWLKTGKRKSRRLMKEELKKK